MSSLGRAGKGLLASIMLAGSLVILSPAQASSLPEGACLRLKGVAEFLARLAEAHPDNQAIAAIAEAAAKFFADNCL